MTIKWPNIIAMLLLVVITITLLTQWQAIKAFFSTLQAIGPGPYDPQERFIGVLMFTLVIVSVICVLRVILNQDRGGTP